MHEAKTFLLKAAIIIAYLFIFPHFAGAGSTSLRCGGSIVTLGDHKAEVVQKCGAPQMEDTIALNTGETASGNGAGPGLPAEETTFIDEWTYITDKTSKIRKTNRIVRLLFERNLLIKIETTVSY